MAAFTSADPLATLREELAACPNVVAKLGGVNMKVNGFDWHKKDKPPSSEELAAAIPGSQFAVMTDCGHWPQFEDADTFNRIHLEFLLG